MNTRTPLDPHGAQPVLTRGPALTDAHAAVIILHGRGADAQDILPLAHEINVPHVTWLGPDAAHNAWYPDRFMQPIANNEPWLTSALAFVHRTVEQVTASGIPAERIVLAGFSQGACLALEYAARNALRYGGVIAFAGGLIGPNGTPRDYAGSFHGTPVFIGVGDQDAHIPVARSRESAEVMQRLGATVDLRVYPGLPHTIIEDQILAARGIVLQAATAPR
jgi:predicted esterase